MTTRLRVSEAGTRATAQDIATNAAIARLLAVVSDGAGGLTVEWETVSQLYSAAWTVTDWYLDGTTGNDANDGTSAATPLRTGAELARRLGPYALWPQSVTVHVLANGMTDGLVLRGSMLVAGSHLDVVGTPTQLVTGTIASYLALSHAAPNGTQITSAAVADWTPLVNQRIRIVGGARDGTVFWALAANPNGVGVDTVRTTRPLRIDQASTTNNVAQITPIVGDAIAVESLPFVPAIMLDIDGPIDTSAGVQYARRQVMISDLWVDSLQVKGAAGLASTKQIVFGLRLQIWASPPASQTSQTTVNATLLANTDASTNGVYRMTGVFQNCGFVSTVGTTNKSLTASIPSTFLSCTFQGMRYRLDGVPCGCYLSNCQIFDYQGGANAAFDATAVFVSNLSGNGNAGYGIELYNNYSLGIFGTWNLQGALGDVRLASIPALTLTIAQSLPTSDFTRKGTATLVGGTVTVVVPWWDPTIQTLTIGRNTPLGAIGDLSVPAASRTNTQFVINSANAGDVSTVDWQISPLGRNIFVSTA